MIVVFVGPSLPHARVLAALNGKPASIRPPAAQGDVYRCWRSRPDVIVLIDGYFNDVPAPWHKEILWVLKQGTTVIGASSMGALRAAELESFGMVGIGAVFEGYRDGRLVADDEVALLHGDETIGYPPVSVPLVNIRATLAAAFEHGVINHEAHEAYLQTARSLHFEDRNYKTLLKQCSISCGEHKLAAWLVEGKVDQKALDAEAALRFAATGTHVAATTSDWEFERTAMWDDLVRRHAYASSDAHDFVDDDILDRLDADSALYQRTAMPALARLLAGEFARQQGRSVGEDELLLALEEFRRRHGLEKPADVTRWMAENHLTVERFVHLIESEVHVESALNSLAGQIEPHLLDQLRISNEYRRSVGGKWEK